MIEPNPWSSEDVRAWSAFLRAHASLVRLIEDDVAREADIPLRWYDVLVELNAAPGRRLRVQQLSDRVVLSRTRVSRVVAELEQAELVAREPNPDDGRSHLVVLTRPGINVLGRAAPIYLEAIRRHFTDRLGHEGLESLQNSLESLAQDTAADRRAVGGPVPRRAAFRRSAE